MRLNINTQKGFTLVEIMVALLITGIMMTLVMQFIFSQMSGYQREQKVSDTQQNLRAVMDELERDIRMAGAGIPKVPVATGTTGLPNNVIYPLYIVQGATINGNTSIFDTASSALSVNDSIIIIYKDPDLPDADGILTQDMPTNADSIIVQTSMINGGTVTKGFPTNGNTPFMITNVRGSTADLFMAGGANNGSGQLTLAAAPVYNNNHAAFPATGYASGSRVFAVKVIRYDFAPTVANFPITKMSNNDTVRGTDNAVGEFFGGTLTNNTTPAGNTNNNALDIAYLPYSGAVAATPFAQGMPADPYDIGTVRITLTARTVAPNASSSLFRTRTLSSNIQPRNYNGGQ